MHTHTHTHTLTHTHKYTYIYIYIYIYHRTRKNITTEPITNTLQSACTLKSLGKYLIILRLHNLSSNLQQITKLIKRSCHRLKSVSLSNWKKCIFFSKIAERIFAKTTNSSHSILLNLKGWNRLKRRELIQIYSMQRFIFFRTKEIQK